MYQNIKEILNTIKNLIKSIWEMVRPGLARIKKKCEYLYLSRSFQNSLYSIGITGTNGKTTTTYVTYQILNKIFSENKSSDFCGLIGGEIIDTKNRQIESELTTPGIKQLTSLYNEMVNNKATHLVMEVSSEGYHQGRTDLIEYNVGIFTNITVEHLNYHKTFENYLGVKSDFISSAKDLAIINNDDPNCMTFINKCYENQLTYMTYGFGSNSDLVLSDLKISLKGTEFTINTDQIKDLQIKTNLIGEFNAYNLAAVICLLIHHDYDVEKIKHIFEDLTPPPGRLQRIKDNIFIDFAHTPDALKNVIDCLKQIDDLEKIIVVAGAGGNRSIEKRPLMGHEMTSADICIITTDNPRDEDPDQIILDVVEGAKNNKINSECKVITETDRRLAIEKAIALLGPNDALLVAGKGNERYMKVKNGQKIPFYDGDVILEMLS